MRPRVRKAVPGDMDVIFLMGHDAWGKGETVPRYLASCRNSSKYKQGEWYLMVDAENGPAASLILYRLNDHSAGIGSIATHPQKRRRGFAAHLIQTIVALLDLQGARAIFLFSDIAPGYYERFGFRALPPEHQKHKNSVCMIRAAAADSYLASPDFELPAYF